MTSRVAVDWFQVLIDVLEKARALGPKAVIAFDLDSTLFDNRPRQAHILRLFGAKKGLPALEQCRAEHFSDGWNLRAAAVACGLPADEVERLYKDLKAFWGARFFTSEFCAEDIEIVGAPRFVQALAATGARIAYVTGRHEVMREGTERCLAKCGFPVPHGMVGLMMKPTARDVDDDYKLVAHEVLAQLGEVIAAFDNEPMHINAYAKRFPTAKSVHLETDHSGRPIAIDPSVISIPHFAY